MQELLNIEQFCQRNLKKKLKLNISWKLRPISSYYWKAPNEWDCLEDDFIMFRPIYLFIILNSQLSSHIEVLFTLGPVAEVTTSHSKNIKY